MTVLKDWLKGLSYEVLMGSATGEVDEVAYDSRKAGPGVLFVCMVGSRTDSHKFIPDVLKDGCRNLVVEKGLNELNISGAGQREPVPGTAGLNIIRVDNARYALALISAARFGRAFEKMTMIGVTGTKGKTSCTYMFKAVLESCGKKVGVIGTNGCWIGDKRYETKNTTPDSYELNSYFAEMLEYGCEYAVMECSSQGFKMDRTAGITFDYGIFLNISPDHIGPLEHEDFDEYMRCKSMLFKQCRAAIVNMDDPHTETMVNIEGRSYERLYRFSINDPRADICAYDLKFKADRDFSGTYFKTRGLSNCSFELDIPGNYNVSNALPVITVAALRDLPMDKVGDALKTVHVDGRMEAVYRSDKFTVIVDYAHNEISMSNLMRTLKEDYHPKRLVAVFGCGGNRSKDRRTGMGAAAAKEADFCVFTADNSRYEKTEDIIADIEDAYLKAGGRPENYVRIPDRGEAIRYCMRNAEKGDIIAVIGKGHEDYQEENGVRRHFLDKEEILKAKEEFGL